MNNNHFYKLCQCNYFERVLHLSLSKLNGMLHNIWPVHEQHQKLPSRKSSYNIIIYNVIINKQLGQLIELMIHSESITIMISLN